MARATAIQQIDNRNLARISKSSACRSVGNVGTKSLADDHQQYDPNPHKAGRSLIATNN